VEVLDGEKNIAIGAPVRAAGGMGTVFGSGSQYWSAASLTDGFGPDGKIVSQREWLLALGHRLSLEQRQHALHEEIRETVAMWRRGGLIVAGIFGGLGLVLLVALPIRYRLREKRQLVEVRERIAGDLHDEVGSNLGSIQMFADLAESHAGPSKELKRIQRIAAETVSAVRDIVWLLRPQGDHRIATVEHLRETCSIMLEPHDWKFTANEAAWQCEMSDDANRHLFLFFREALHNILRHANASQVAIHIECDPAHFRLRVSDDGSGITPEKMARPSTLRALRKRVEALGAGFDVSSEPGKGTVLDLDISLGGKKTGRLAKPKP
jgi:signal transduction histidine kinase